MISKKDVAKLKEMGFDPEAIAAAVVADKETDITIPSGSFWTDDKIEELRTNVKAGHEQAYPEILGKQLNKEYELGLTGADAKDLKKIADKLREKGKSEAQVEPNTRIQELEKSLKKLQEEVIPTTQKEATEWKSKYQERETYDKYASLIPENANKFLTKDEHVTRVRKAYTLNEDGTVTDNATGAIVKDKLEKAVAAKDIISEAYTKNEGWLQPASAPQPIHHSTSTTSVSGRGNANYDHNKVIAEVYTKYDQTTPEGRAMARNEVATAMANATKV